MSFYIVPSVSYQTQQKIKQAQKKAKHKKSKKHGDKSDSKLNSPSSSTNASIRASSIYEEPIEEEGQHKDTTSGTSVSGTSASISGSSNNDEFPNNLTDKLSSLKRTESSGSIASKYIESPKSTNQNTSYFEIKPGTFSSEGNSPANITDNINFQHLDINERRRNSTSTSSSVPRMRLRQNSSLSLASQQTVMSNKDKEKSKLANPTDSEDNESINSKSSKIFKPNYSPTTSFEFPRFECTLDLTVMNSIETITESFYSPTFQIFRFKNFLDILRGQHDNDPINFANIRYNSISKFLLRHNDFTDVAIEDVVKGFDIKNFEGVLSCSLISMRSFIRKLIRYDSNKTVNRSEIYSCEELVQINFTNYLRFILNLPQSVLTAPAESLTEYQLVHQKFKIMFTRLIKALHTFQKEDSGDDLSTATNAVAFLFQLITKVSYDYILLEKYHINILTKLSNNCLIDGRLASTLFDKYQNALSSPDSFQPPKVLFYNAYFSVQYSWYLSVTVPFVRVFESNIFNENANLISNYEKYKEMEKTIKKTNFQDSDQGLYDSHFKKLNLESFGDFKSMTDEQLVDLQRATEIPDDVEKRNNFQGSHKPQNFEFYGNSLATLEEGTFDLIQCRDLLFQLTNTNYKTLISEFYRVLKTGGVLEIPIILSGADTIKSDNSIVGLPKFTRTTGSDLSSHYDMIPNFAEVLLTTIIEVFGDDNVKFSCVLLNSSNEITSFLARDIGLHVAEIISKTDEFCKQFYADQGTVNQDVHFFFPIQAIKL
ncbi:hypothetical protein CLIB1444_16S00606 [[Candida] jaroonii]|uniref:Uncharacterized protein n=1 Tax=[Candida] jaroonii TaxID=467808 RepID=A0ACA9YEJ9_9ASCO|nr:hypothetical protein CLIB1444_16S00606 [[Candida] jaroonii]